MGFWTVFSNAAYAYSSVETISMAAAETYAPRRNIPKAAKRVFVRILLFYGMRHAYWLSGTQANDESYLHLHGYNPRSFK